MKQTLILRNLAGLELSVRPSAFITFVIVWVILSTIGVLLLRLSAVEAIIGGLVAALLHWFGDLWHQLSHAWAARRTGYPMRGIRFWGPLSTSLYPRDEPELSPNIHIRRALGGPAGSFLLTLIAGAIALATYGTGGGIWWVALFFFLDNLLTFTLGAFLPLGFTDGNTLLYWLPRKE